MRTILILSALTIGWTTTMMAVPKNTPVLRNQPQKFALEEEANVKEQPDMPEEVKEFDGLQVKRLFGDEFLGGLHKVGKGSTGTTYALWNTTDNRPYLVKVTSARKKNGFKRAQIEAAVLKKLNNINLIEVYDAKYDKETDNFYQLMEFAVSGNLAQAREKNAQLFSNPIFLHNLFLGIARGIRYLHSKGIVHADIKPKNIVLSDDNTPLIIDLDFATVLNKPAEYRGTSWFVDLRLANAKKMIFDAGVDVFSLGSTMYLLNQPYLPDPNAGSISELHDFMLLNNYDVLENTEATMAYLINGCRQLNMGNRLTIDKVINILVNSSSNTDYMFVQKLSFSIYQTTDPINYKEFTTRKQELLKKELEIELKKKKENDNQILEDLRFKISLDEKKTTVGSRRRKRGRKKNC